MHSGFSTATCLPASRHGPGEVGVGRRAAWRRPRASTASSASRSSSVGVGGDAGELGLGRLAAHRPSVSSGGHEGQAVGLGRRPCRAGSPCRRTGRSRRSPTPSSAGVTVGRRRRDERGRTMRASSSVTRASGPKPLVTTRPPPIGRSTIAGRWAKLMLRGQHGRDRRRSGRASGTGRRTGNSSTDRAVSGDGSVQVANTSRAVDHLAGQRAGELLQGRAAWARRGRRGAAPRADQLADRVDRPVRDRARVADDRRRRRADSSRPTTSAPGPSGRPRIGGGCRTGASASSHGAEPTGGRRATGRRSGSRRAGVHVSEPSRSVRAHARGRSSASLLAAAGVGYLAGTLPSADLAAQAAGARRHPHARHRQPRRGQRHRPARQEVGVRACSPPTSRKGGSPSAVGRSPGRRRRRPRRRHRGRGRPLLPGLDTVSRAARAWPPASASAS